MSDRRRRKSLSILRPPLGPLTPINEPSPDSSKMQEKKRRTLAFGFGSNAGDGINETESPSPTTSLHSLREVASKASMDRLLSKTRPKGLPKTGRPTSLFGSMKASSSAQDVDDGTLTRTTSTLATADAEKFNELSKSKIIADGEIQTAGSIFRKKKEYFVLTDTHLLSFKSKFRASEMFSSIPSSFGKSSGLRHSRISSSGSLHELQSPSSSSDNSYVAAPLTQIVAVYKLDDGRPYFSVQISCLDEDTMQTSETTLQIHDPTESEFWLSSIRGAAMKARLYNPVFFSQKLIEHTVRALEQEQDYDPNQFHMFKVVQRATRAEGRSSTDDLTKVTSNICILAIGTFKVHLIALPKLSRTLSNTSLIDRVGATHGIATFTGLSIQDSDDAFTLTFRMPLCRPNIYCLACYCSGDIALWLRQATEYIRPMWIEQPLLWTVSQSIEDAALPLPNSDDDEIMILNRTLCAYCAAYGINASRFRYQIRTQCEDAPEFILLPPSGSPYNYSLLELLAIMRTLRYNETFGSISFSDVKLDPLRERYDPHGEDHVPWTTRMGAPLDVGNQSQFSLLVQEVQALAVKSKRLRRLNFSDTLANRTTRDLDNNAEDPGCGLCEALFPLCAKEYTNVDWITLDGIVLKEVDLDYIYNATIDRKCHFRAIEVGFCGLTERNLDTVLHALSYQSSTMEVIDISGNPARLESSWLKHVRSFEFMRIIRLSNILRTSVPEPLLPADILMTWKLEEIKLSNTTLNTETIEALNSYLSHPQSRYLKYLALNQCQLTGDQVADILNATHRGVVGARDLDLQVSGNLLEKGNESFMTAISRNWTPGQMAMERIYFRKERNFRALLSAFQRNQTTRHLDISKFVLPSDASEETCEALRGLFTFNQTLEYLDISSERTHIEAAGLGKGICTALNGLKHNETLKVLKIQHQALGLPGANTLASVLEENKCLQELHCEGNEINLQGFTTLVNSIKHNTNILYLSSMALDRNSSQTRMNREVKDIQENNTSPTGNLASTKATVRKTFGRSIGGSKPSRTQSGGSLAGEELKAVIGSISQSWDMELARLQEYLDRNYALAHGLPVEESALDGLARPGTGDTLTKALEDIDIDDKSPTAELDPQLEKIDDQMKKETLGEEIDDDVDETEETEKPLEIGKSLHN